MIYTSLAFILFFIALVLLYFTLPKKLQWLVLLCGNIYFYMFAGVKLSIFILTSTIVAYFAGLLTDKVVREGAAALATSRAIKTKDELREIKAKYITLQRWILAFALIMILGILLLCKYMGLFTDTINRLLTSTGYSLPVLSLALPLGISFYTFALIGYLLDVYRGICKGEKNFLRLLLFSSFFPCVVQGPISRYKELSEQLYVQHRFQYDEAALGLQRMLWGFAKKLIIADRIGILVSTVYDNAAQYEGFTLAFATIAFAVQLYADFSGCMDIVLGAAQILGIKLTENFNAPFSSHSIAEYWRRWHITLGAWFKDYVFYPLLKSRLLVSTGKRLAKLLGKNAAAKITTYTGMLVLWFLLGLWHGASWNFVIGTGLLHWCYMVLGDALAPLSKRVQRTLHINTQSQTYSAFTCVRTFLLVCVGFVFFRAPTFNAAITVFKNMLQAFNPWVLLDGSLLQLGLDSKDFIVLVVFIALLILIDSMSQKTDVRALLAQKELPIRWTVHFLLFASVLLFGIYGPSYDPTPFIYVRF